MKIIGYFLVAMICLQGVLSTGFVMESMVMRPLAFDSAPVRKLADGAKEAGKDCDQTNNSTADNG